MGKKVSAAVPDAALNHVKNNGNQMILLDAEPANRAAAITAALVTAAMVAGDYTLANGDVSGRKVTMGAKAGQSVAVGGNHNHTCIISATDLLIVTTTPATKTLNAGDTVDVPAWDYELPDPV